MEFDRILEERRSVRDYDGTAVSKEEIEEMVKAAILAPSWKNSQTARYYAILDRDFTEKVSVECLPAFNQKNCQGAGALVITTFIRNRSGFEKTGEPSNEAENLWGAYDLGLHNENFVLKAKDMGLDTLIMGIRDEKKIREMIEIPENEIILSVIAVGHGEREASMPKRKSVDDILKVF